MTPYEIAEILAAHRPACSGPYGRPTDGRACGPLYCRPCSERAGEWVTWTPQHVAAYVARGTGCYICRPHDPDADPEGCSDCESEFWRDTLRMDGPR